MKALTTTIFLVDDDRSVRESTKVMLESMGFSVTAFASAQDFLDNYVQEGPCCLILDVRMPGISGLELQEKLMSAHSSLPIIFITGHGTVPMSVRAMKAGAVDFLEKPFEEQDLLDAINRALAQQRQEVSRKEEADDLGHRLDALTPREFEVFSLIVDGMANKEIAYRLGTTERTVKFHRANIMGKTDTKSLADLVRLAEKAKNRS
jgi:two-component system, LuxR family, response regulator FixJ